MSSAPPDPARKTPLPPRSRQWWVRFPSGRQFGPLERGTVEQWVREGRAGSDCLVAFEGAGSWRPIATEFPEVTVPREIVPLQRDYSAGKNILAELPARGLLDALPDGRAGFDSETDRLHQAVHDRLARECERSALGLRFLGSRSLRLRQSLPPDPGLGPPTRLVAETILFAAVQWMEQEFYCVVPWGDYGQLPHEFFSIHPGRFPGALALRRKSENVFDHGIWIDCHGNTDSEITRAARHAQVDLVEGINWRWVSPDTRTEMILIWGFQATPLGFRSCLHILQTGTLGALRRTFGIDWYLHRQQAFAKFRDSAPMVEDLEPHFLFGCVTGQLLARLCEL